MRQNIVTEKTIGGKKIYIVENHHEVIIPWAEYASNTNTSPILLTFDHHIDTRTAFIRYSKNLNEENWKETRNTLISDVDINKPDSILQALEKLRNDEHIDLSIETGILSEALVFSLMNAGICKDFGNDYIYYIDPDCISTCNKDFHDDDCMRKKFDGVIEDSELLFKLKKANRFIPSIYSFNTITNPYILDIDLDTFNTEKGINPENTSIFYDLIRNSEIITIATEPSYVELEKIDDDIHMEVLLDKLLKHIECAMDI